MKLMMFLGAAASALVLSGGVASAALTYVGSWEVDQGPYWPSVPPAYSGQEAAALLFGGTAADYVISTVDSNPADVNDSAWISTWGGACGGTFPCGTVVPQNYVVSSEGFYANPGDTSAYVSDWAIGSQYTNYAFTAGVPEPAAWALMLVGFGGLGAAMRGRRRTAVAFD